MNALEQKFAQTVKEQKSTIYTVCYMFSKEGLRELRKPQRHPYMDLPRSPEHLYLRRQEEASQPTFLPQGKRRTTAVDGHQPLRRPR